MKIILVVNGAKGKNVVFVSDTLQTYSLEEAVAATHTGVFQNISVVNRRTGAYLRTKPEHSISFAAARMRALIDKWKKFVDLDKRPEIVATLYSLGRRDPHPDPEANERGMQIIKEFYPLSQEWLH